ncbi:MAG: zinc ABC transporter substrate-binding protein, partial [Gammaproteobacteria bacterium]|nr:zinc ABC transporter substrate-binding protein [Gammaproteobacteria bacterium]
GTAGYFSAADHVRLREVPTRLDRSEGDVHPAGNPHIQTDPRNISRVAQALAQRLAQLDPASATLYQARYRDFSRRWSAALARWESQAKPLKGIAVVTEHKNWIYLFDWLGMHEVASLEPKPGVPPSAAYLARVLEELKQRPARMVIYAADQDPRPALWLAKRTPMPAVELPFTVGGTPQAGDLFELFDDTLHRLLQAVP